MSLPHLARHATVIITGAYGSGKTECALALAACWAAREPVTLVDLDFVNPYFRAQDHAAELRILNVHLIAPDPHVAPLDAPALPPAARHALLHPSGCTIVDLGGDPDGAVVIGQFAPEMRQYDCWATVNFARPTTATPAQAADVLEEIAAATRLRITGLISNTHFGLETTADDLTLGVEQAQQLSACLRIPLVFACAPSWLPLPSLPVPWLIITPRLQRPWEMR